MQETSCSLQPGAYFCRATLDFSAINYLGNSSQPVLHNYYTPCAALLLS